MVNSGELIGTTKYLTLWTRCRWNRCRYNRVRLYYCHAINIPLSKLSVSVITSNDEVFLQQLSYGPSGRAVLGIGLRPFACWDYGCESHRAWMSVCCECCVLSGRSLCNDLITHPEESYRLWRVVVFEI